MKGRVRVYILSNRNVKKKIMHVGCEDGDGVLLWKYRWESKTHPCPTLLSFIVRPSRVRFMLGRDIGSTSG